MKKSDAPEALLAAAKGVLAEMCVKLTPAGVDR